MGARSSPAGTMCRIRMGTSFRRINSSPSAVFEEDGPIRYKALLYPREDSRTCHLLHRRRRPRGGRRTRRPGGECHSRHYAPNLWTVFATSCFTGTGSRPEDADLRDQECVTGAVCWRARRTCSSRQR
jgi:hypothetical protein